MKPSDTKVLAIIARVARKDAATLKPEHQLVGDLGIDSPKALQLMCELEDELRVEIPDEAPSRIATVQDVLELAEALTHA
jgi:acyl carrier protein